MCFFRVEMRIYVVVCSLFREKVLSMVSGVERFFLSYVCNKEKILRNKNE
mgnify:CR=1 FL=1